MITKIIITFLLFLILFAVPASAASARKYTFNDVNIDGTIVEIEASVRENKNPYSTCQYYSDNYLSYLGSYSQVIVAGKTAPEVLNFCVANYPLRK